MKILLIFILALFHLLAQSATWTIHSTKDYTANFNVGGPNTGIGLAWSAGAYWDYWNDSTYPEYAYSGTWFYNGLTDQWTTVVSYSDVQVVQTPDDTITQVYFGVCGFGPVYGGGGEIIDTTGTYPPGEYWIDIGLDGLVRVSTVYLPDFGKWAWDGSVNPSWVEPLALKTNRGKKHRK